MLSLQSFGQAYNKQDIINILTKAGEAYWAQRVVIDKHQSGRIFYGYSGNQTVIEPGKIRYYDSDANMVTQPHIFTESEDSKGISGVLYAYVKAYEATQNKFFLRTAKSLGETLIQAQTDNGTGGWWHDMGVEVDAGREDLDNPQNKFVNYFPWGERVNAWSTYQNLGDNDGASWLQAFALLRLEQILPENDVDKGGKYLASAKWYADTMVELKDIIDDPDNFKPYGIGGIPQMFPYGTMKNRMPIDFCRGCTSLSDYPLGYQDFPHNVMITLNDDAMGGAVFFLAEFSKEAETNPTLNANKYLDAVRLNINYLINVFDEIALPNGRSGWASFYHIQDGSVGRENRPTWGRSMEPPGIWAVAARADDILVYWYLNEQDLVLKQEIERVLVAHTKFWKYEATKINGNQTYLDIIASDGSDPVVYTPITNWTVADGQYDSNNPLTWYYWYVVNHDPTLGPIGVPVSATDKQGVPNYVRYIGQDAVRKTPVAHYNISGYPPGIGASMGQSVASVEIALFLNEAQNSYNFEHSMLEYYHKYDVDRRFFIKEILSQSKVNQAMANFDEASNYFLPTTQQIKGTSYTVISDDVFSQRMSWLAWGKSIADGNITDSDGDSINDIDEINDGTDPYDSENNQVVSVELETFTAELAGKVIELNWQTTTKVNNYNFEIERQYQEPSIKNQDWIKIGFIEGHGNSNSPKKYSFTDNTITQAGKYSYRLKQTDIDGKFEYSNIIEMTISVPLKFELFQNYPNPFNPATNISFTLPNDSNVRLSILNVLGQEITELINENKKAGFHNYTFDASSLSSGVYYYRITTENFVKTKRIILMK